MLSDLLQAIALYTHIIAVYSHPSPPNPLYLSAALNNLPAALSIKFSVLGQISDLNMAIQMQEKIVQDLPALSEPSFALHNLAISYQTRFEKTGNTPDLQNAIDLHEKALPLRPLGHIERFNSLDSLDDVLSIMFDISGDILRLRRLIEVRRLELVLRPADHPERSAVLDRLSSALSVSFTSVGSLELPELREMIDMYEESLVLRPLGHPQRYSSLANLAVALLQKFEHQGNDSDLGRAIKLCQDSLELCASSDPGRFKPLHTLADALVTRFHVKGHAADLDKALEYLENAGVLCPSNNTDQAMLLNSRSNALLTRSTISGVRKDLDDAIAIRKECLLLCPSGHPSHTIILSNLANSMTVRYRQTSEMGDLSCARKIYESILCMHPPGHPNRAKSLSRLADCLHLSYDHSGSMADLQSSVELHEEALSLRSTDHPERPISLHSLAAILIKRFKNLGIISDLDRVVEFAEEALRLYPDGHSKRSHYLNNLALALVARFEAIQNSDDLDVAIRHYEEALQLRPPLHPLHPESQNNLANALVRRFRSDGFKHIDDLNDAIEMYVAVLSQRQSGREDRLYPLNNLANAFCMRYEFLEEPAELDYQASISLHEEALSLAPTGHPMHCSVLINISKFALAKFQKSDDAIALKKAISFAREARDNALDHYKVDALDLLGKLYLLGREPDITQSITAFSLGARFELGLPSKRFGVAKAWIECALRPESVALCPSVEVDATAAYIAAIDLLPLLFLFELDATSRLSVLRQAPSLASDAAAWLSRQGNECRAVELLEQGRAVFWSFSRQISNKFGEVPGEVGVKFRTLSERLQVMMSTDSSQSGLAASAVTRSRRELQDEWTDTVEEVRKIAGLEHFLKAKPYEELRQAAKNGPIVMLIASDHGCFAIIIRSETSTPDSIILPISREDVLDLGKRLEEVLCLFGIRRHRVHSARNNLQDSDPLEAENKLQRILAEIWDKAVKHVIKRLELQVCLVYLSRSRSYVRRAEDLIHF